MGQWSQTPTIFSSVFLKVDSPSHQCRGKKGVSNSWEYSKSNESSSFEISKTWMCPICQLLCCTTAFFKVKGLVAQSCLAVCDLMDCSPPGSSVHGILQAGILECVAISFSRGSSQPKEWTRLLHWQADSLPLSHLGSLTLLGVHLSISFFWAIVKSFIF